MAEYIEREAAIANSREYNLGGSYDNTERAVPVETINSIRAADVRPVVRGFNVSKDYPSLFECSVCGWSDGDTTTGDTRTYNFCPNCGADMREES